MAQSNTGNDLLHKVPSSADLLFSISLSLSLSLSLSSVNLIHYFRENMKKHLCVNFPSWEKCFEKARSGFNEILFSDQTFNSPLKAKEFWYFFEKLLLELNLFSSKVSLFFEVDKIQIHAENIKCTLEIIFLHENKYLGKKYFYASLLNKLNAFKILKYYVQLLSNEYLEKKLFMYYLNL